MLSEITLLKPSNTISPQTLRNIFINLDVPFNISAPDGRLDIKRYSTPSNLMKILNTKFACKQQTSF